MSASQPYWYASYGGGGSNPAAHAQHDNPQEVSLILRDRDIKTQRRKEANRESARRSKQRKKEESELLSSKAEELVRESMSLRAELEKIQQQANRLYTENMELRNQVANAGGLLPPSPERFVPVKLPPPVKLPASLLKEVGNASNAVKQEQPTSTGSRAESEGIGWGDVHSIQASAMPAMIRTADDVLGHGNAGLPGLLGNELPHREVVNGDPFARLPPQTAGLKPAGYSHFGANGGGGVPGDVLMNVNEAIASSFCEPDREPLFVQSGTLDEWCAPSGVLRNTHHFVSGKSLGATIEEFSLARQSDVGQGG